MNHFLNIIGKLTWLLCLLAFFWGCGTKTQSRQEKNRRQRSSAPASKKGSAGQSQKVNIRSQAQIRYCPDSGPKDSAATGCQNRPKSTAGNRGS
jgi:hypothetical protein